MYFAHAMESVDAFIIINLNPLGHPYLDSVMKTLSSTWTLAGLLGIVLGFHVRPKALKSLLLFLFFLLIGTGICDYSTNWVKHEVKRLRPSHTPGVESKLRYVTIKNTAYKGGTYGFFSSHAANTAFCCWFLWLFIKPTRNRYFIILMLFTVLCGYSRLYMGVHYLSDVTAGWIYGTLLAFGSNFIFKRWISAKQHS